MFKRKYLLRRDSADSRDRILRVDIPKELPPVVDFRSKFPPVMDQGSLGSCTANAIGAALDFMHKINNPDKDFFYPSRLFIYYNERAMEGTIGEDAGACIRDGIKSVNVNGACREATWPYKINVFASKPSEAAYKEAEDYQAIAYLRVPLTEKSVKAVLAQGMPVVFGIALYASFEADSVMLTGKVPMPNVDTEQSLGGHAVCMAGYDDSKSAFIVRNSWGPDWGDKGYFYLPYAYVANSQLAFDAWTITKAE